VESDDAGATHRQDRFSKERLRQRPKRQPTANIYIYYANSESQLLRQASRLNNLNKKLVGDLAQPSEDIRELASMSNLGASVYGDTRFDDTILPGYVEFIHSLVTARSLEQENFQLLPQGVARYIQRISGWGIAVIPSACRG
jgi:hypothetical protein